MTESSIPRLFGLGRVLMTCRAYAFWMTALVCVNFWPTRFWQQLGDVETLRLNVLPGRFATLDYYGCPARI